MMKRKYLTPETIKVTFYGKIVMSAASPDSERNVGGGPSEDEGFPTTVGETEEGTDPYGGHGQGSGGSGNRSKGFDLWGWD